MSTDDTGSTVGGTSRHGSFVTPVTDVVDVRSPTVVYAWLPWHVVLLLVGVVRFHG